MKNILYISEFAGYKNVTGSLNTISKIWRHARTSNANQQITGVLVYQNHHFLQVLEGPDENVDALMKKIQQDTRHNNVIVLFEKPANERVFSLWTMRLLASCNDTKLIGLISDYIHNTPKIPKQHRILLEKFYDFPSHQNIKHAPQDFSDFHIKLLTWPNFNNVAPSIALIDLCSLLINSYQHYSNVLLQHSFNDEKELNKMLDYLYTLGVLDLQKAKKKSISQKTQNKSANKNSFYQKMRLFLTK